MLPFLSLIAPRAALSSCTLSPMLFFFPLFPNVSLPHPLRRPQPVIRVFLLQKTNRHWPSVNAAVLILAFVPSSGPSQ